MLWCEPSSEDRFLKVSVLSGLEDVVNPDAQSQGISADEAARAALDGLGAHIVVVDCEGMVVTANAPWCQYGDDNGFQGENNAIGMNYIEVAEAATGEEREEGLLVAEALRDILAGKRAEFRHRYPCHSPTEKHWFKLIITPTRLAGRPAAVVMHLDITERHLAEQAAIEAHKAAETATRAKSRFLADLSHEVRTPLNAIVGFSETIDQQIFGPIGNTRYEEYVGHIRSSAAHLIDLLSDTLDSARMDHHELVLDEDTVDLNAAVALAKIVSHGALRERHLGLRILIAPEVDRLRLDRRLFVQTVANLVTNSAKVSPQGGEIVVEANISADGRPTIRVLDRGPGIPDAMKETVFQAFQRCGPTPVADRGAGLGLAIVSKVVAAHGGEISAHDRDGGGTEMRIAFPANRIPASI
jgi:signal transduction histidine kinase